MEIQDFRTHFEAPGSQGFQVHTMYSGFITLCTKSESMVIGNFDLTMFVIF